MADSARSSSDSPQISVLVPIFNVEKYLRQCLQSLVDQSYSDFEVICINDGSSDGSRDIIEQFLSDPRFRVIDKPNSGYGASMNQGLDAACGRYVAILESDDFLDPDGLADLFKLAESNQADVVKANFYFYWSVPGDRNEVYEFVSPSMADRVLAPLDDLRIFYRKPSIWAALYRAEFLRENRIRFLETPGASYQDAGFSFKVWSCARRVVLTRSAYLHYRQDNESSSVNSPGKVYCVCDEYAEMERFIDSRPDLPSELKGVLLRMKYDSYIWNYERLQESLQIQFLQRMAEEFSRHIANHDPAFAHLEPWKAKDLRQIVKDPNAYHRSRSRFAKLGSLGKALHYLLANGPAMMVRMAREKKLESL